MVARVRVARVARVRILVRVWVRVRVWVWVRVWLRVRVRVRVGVRVIRSGGGLVSTHAHIHSRQGRQACGLRRVGGTFSESESRKVPLSHSVMSMCALNSQSQVL